MPSRISLLADNPRGGGGEGKIPNQAQVVCDGPRGREEAKDERCGGWVRGWQQLPSRLSLCISPPTSLTVAACGVIGH